MRVAKSIQEDKMPEKKEEPKVTAVETVVVTELPKQDVRSFVGQNGVEYHVVTIDEALTEILETVRSIKKSVA